MITRDITGKTFFNFILFHKSFERLCCVASAPETDLVRGHAFQPSGT